jgi:N-acyl-D-aspartate/D-glutamate deacylase
VLKRFFVFAVLGGAIVQGQAQSFDIVIRNGTVIDGSGNPRFDADVGITNGFIAAIGELDDATAGTHIDATGLFVSPGFINIHSHASPDALPTAVNMLTQGVTTEIFNADGGGPPDIAQQMSQLAAAGLAVNIGGYVGFNQAWATVVGTSDRRPTPDEIAKMRGMIALGLSQGAWGVSAGLDYKPGYFARTEEVVQIVDVARPARTNFTNHDRITPESNFSSKAGVAETVAIGQKSGLVPVVTHMKVQGHEQGSATTILSSMAQATKLGHYTAADAYPYLAGQSGLGALIIPAWAVEGGRDAMLKRFADPTLRSKIITEAEQAMKARFGGADGIYLPRTQQQLTAVMTEMNAGPGEAVLRILEQGDPGAILRFGLEDDLVKILKDPVTAMACDCGASTATRVHPRFYGSYPRVLGRYVREQKTMTWEDAIRKSSWLPASTVGMTDRGLLALGMAADVTVFDPKTVIDHATYESPALLSEGIKFVVVNGRVVLENGARTNARPGRALYRTHNMPSRPVSRGLRSVKAQGTAGGRRVSINLTQRAGGREATGTVEIEGLGRMRRFGVLQVTNGWAHFSAFSEVTRSGTGTPESGSIAVVEGGRAIAVFVDLHDPSTQGQATVAVDIDGRPWLRGSLPRSAAVISHR